MKTLLLSPEDRLFLVRALEQRANTLSAVAANTGTDGARDTVERGVKRHKELGEIFREPGALAVTGTSKIDSSTPTALHDLKRHPELVPMVELLLDQRDEAEFPPVLNRVYGNGECREPPGRKFRQDKVGIVSADGNSSIGATYMWNWMLRAGMLLDQDAATADQSAADG